MKIIGHGCQVEQWGVLSGKVDLDVAQTMGFWFAWSLVCYNILLIFLKKSRSLDVQFVKKTTSICVIEQGG